MPFRDDGENVTDYITQPAQSHRYESHLGKYPIPIAGEATEGEASVRVVTLHRPWGRRIVDFSATKNHAPPILPSPVDSRSGDIIMCATVEIGQPVPLGMDSEGMLWAAAGTYEYIQTNVRGSTSRYETGLWPMKMAFSDGSPNAAEHIFIDPYALEKPPYNWNAEQIQNPAYSYISTTYMPELFSEVIC